LQPFRTCRGPRLKAARKAVTTTGQNVHIA
jgi:hypothetical protein